MNIAVIGSGGREHALAYQIKKSPQCRDLYIIPGNAGTASVGQNVDLDTNDNEKIVEFCHQNDVHLVVVGPEAPLVNGMVDALTEAGITAFGPKKRAAMIEADKAFAKDVMNRYGIPTAAHKEFAAEDYDEAVKYLETQSLPVVIKANGLAAGKGVAICKTKEEAVEALKASMVDKAFGSAGDKVLIEEFMEGEEASIFAVSDGKNFYILPPAQDHKPVGEGDTGPNTGGMGAYAPAPLIDDALLFEIEETIITPTLNGMKEDGNPFIGCLYAGLMITEDGPKVVEYNCRFGDPETQAVVPLIEGDFLLLLFSAAKRDLDPTMVNYTDGAAVCVVAASGGYPGSYEKGKKITGLEEADDKALKVFHAGTKKDGDDIVSSGGRVLGVTSILPFNDLGAAIKKAYEGIEKISFEGMFYRKDIGEKGLKRL